MRRLLWILLVLVIGSAPLLSESGKKRLTPELVNRTGALISPGLTGLAWRPKSAQVSYLRSKPSSKPPVSSLWLYDAPSGKESLLFDPSSGEEGLTPAGYQWSPNGDALLLTGDHDLWLFDVASGRTRRLTKDPEAEEEPTFSPTGDRIAFVKQGDLYTVDLKIGLIERLTRDGGQHIFNGKLDWVYEEELSHRRSGRSYTWSPDGKKIAYLRLDENRVPEYPLTDYMATHPRLIRQRYPKAGDPNAVPSVHVVTVGERASKISTIPLKATVEYVGPDFSWTPDSSEICFLTLNRAQNELTVHLWNPASGEDRTLLVEKDPYWINSIVPPHFLGDGRRFLWLSERTGFLHLYLYNRDGTLVQPLTRGEWMIDGAFEANAQGDWVFFTATEKDPRERHLYRVRTDGAGFERISKEAGVHKLNPSSDGRFLIETFSSVDQPPQTRLLRSDGSVVATLDKPENHLSEFAPAKTEFVELKADDGTTLYGRLVKPADFKPSKKYPVVVFVYGGPHSQVVQNQWDSNVLTRRLLAQEGFLVWSVDNRGSWGRGHAWETAVFKDLGRRELQDQQTGVTYLKSLPFVDATRLGVWGWSYGGYMTLYALTKAPDLFKCGLAGAPVTDWKFYDTIYTERYMRTPQENGEGYKNSSPLEAAAQLKAKLLIMHGTADDNVHMQNTMTFIDALVKARRPYDLQIQPGQKHGFRGDTAKTYLTETLLAFFKRNL